MTTRRRGLAVVLVLGIVVTPAAAQGKSKAKPRPKPAPSITLQWVGDMALSTQRGLPAGGLGGALAPVAGTLRNADVTTGNLEGTLSTSGPSKCGGIGGGTCFAFQAPPSSAFGLRGAGFDLVNQANNHSFDYGATGRAQTIAALRRAGVASTGLPGQITYLRVRGLRVAFLGFAPYDNTSNLLDIPTATRMVAAARRHAQIVVVFIHAGAEGTGAVHVPYGSEFYVGEDRGSARAFTHAVIRAGASLILGSGPHVIRGIEDYRGRMIAYSLGNFVGYHTLGGGGVLDDSGIIRVRIEPGGRLRSARWIPIRLAGGLPHHDPSGASTELLRTLSSQDFPGDHFTIRHNGAFVL